MADAPIFLPALGVVNALGRGKAAVAQGLFRGDGAGLVREPGWVPGAEVLVGRVPGALPEARSRAHGLLLAAAAELREDLARALARYGPRRIGVVIGTSTSGIDHAEAAMAWRRSHGALPGDFRFEVQEMGSLARFLADRLELAGPAFTISTACTSSGKALASARTLIRAGLCDAVVAGGADALCRMTLNGFTALGAVAPGRCNPMSRNRDGITIGEGAALFLVTREEAATALLGIGETSDAYHMSSPDPEGRGAEAAMAAALREAGRTRVDYLNLHATATPKNDEMESRAVARALPAGTPCSGTKPLTGHTLGAAAATELAFCWLAMDPQWNPEGALPPHLWDGEPDPELPGLALVDPGARPGRPGFCLSTSFAFGGNNLALALGRP